MLHGRSLKRGLAAEEGPKKLESLPEEKNLKEQEQQEGTQMSVPARGVRRSRGHCRDRGSMISKRDAQLLDGAPWLVHVSSIDLDGKEILRCSGTVIHWDKEKAWILTSYRVVFWENEARLYSPMPKRGIGGPVINHAGEIIGMSCYYDEDLAIISITTIRICITMWTKFGCIARPMLGMSFRTVKLLDIVRQDRLSYKYKINDGFIVDEVTVHSDAEKHGIRRGNVISFSNVDPRYLPEFEDHLLNIGLDSLNGTSQVNDFKLEVNDLVGKVTRNIILPLQISYGSQD